MARLTDVFKATGLSDFPVEYNLKGVDNDIEVAIEVSDAMWTIASITGDLRTAIRVSMAADIAAMDTVLKIGTEKICSVQREYGVNGVWGLNDLFKTTIENAIDSYCEACSKLADKLRNENKKLEQL
jgi:hypothetical protein